MKIGIVGTRGIPNFYGGFEEFAQHLSESLVKRGHQVSVYNPHSHTYKKSDWCGVDIIRCYDPESKIGTIGQFIYDFNCILDSRKRGFDIILQLGYTSSSIWNWMFSKESCIITNMDGLEWKRSKYSRIVRVFLQFAERLAIYFSDHLIADAPAIKSYLDKKYHIKSSYIPYGAVLSEKFDKSFLSEYNLDNSEYYMLVARMEPENNIQMILEAFTNCRSLVNKRFIVAGNMNSSYGRYIRERFSDSRILYLGYISDKEKLNSLRHFSDIYFHGHSVGGTNPSLLEAMACGSYICAHDNQFNKYILSEDAMYFKDTRDIANLLNETSLPHNRERWVLNNLQKIRDNYSWKKIVDDYESIMSMREGL